MLAPELHDGRAGQRARLAGLSTAVGPGSHRAARGRRLAAPERRGRCQGAMAVRNGSEAACMGRYIRLAPLRFPQWTPMRRSSRSIPQLLRAIERQESHRGTQE